MRPNMNKLIARLKQPSLPIICILLLLLESPHMMAQGDYLITANGDTVPGIVKSHKKDVLKFLKLDSRKAGKIKASDLLGFYSGSDGHFVPLVLPDAKKQQFLKVVEKGRLSIYELNISGTYSNTFSRGPGQPMAFGTTSYNNITWFARKGDGPLVELKKNSWITLSRRKRRDAFTDLIQDNAAVAKRYDEVDKFTFDFIRQLVIEYNLKQPTASH